MAQTIKNEAEKLKHALSSGEPGTTGREPFEDSIREQFGTGTTGLGGQQQYGSGNTGLDGQQQGYSSGNTGLGGQQSGEGYSSGNPQHGHQGQGVGASGLTGGVAGAGAGAAAGGLAGQHGSGYGSGRDTSDLTSGRDASNYDSGRGASDLTSGRDTSNFDSGRDTSGLNSGRDTSDYTSGRETSGLGSGRDTSDYTSGRETSGLGSGRETSGLTSGRDTSDMSRATGAHEGRDYDNDRVGALDQQSNLYERTGERGPATSGAAGTDRFDSDNSRSGLGSDRTSGLTGDNDRHTNPGGHREEGEVDRRGEGKGTGGAMGVLGTTDKEFTARDRTGAGAYHDDDKHFRGNTHGPAGNTALTGREGDRDNNPVARAKTNAGEDVDDFHKTSGERVGYSDHPDHKKGLMDKIKDKLPI